MCDPSPQNVRYALAVLVAWSALPSKLLRLTNRSCVRSSLDYDGEESEVRRDKLGRGEQLQFGEAAVKGLNRVTVTKVLKKVCEYARL